VGRRRTRIGENSKRRPPPPDGYIDVDNHVVSPRKHLEIPGRTPRASRLQRRSTGLNISQADHDTRSSTPQPYPNPRSRPLSSFSSPRSYVYDTSSDSLSGTFCATFSNHYAEHFLLPGTAAFHKGKAKQNRGCVIQRTSLWAKISNHECP
jgi:hypothetical protein